MSDQLHALALYARGNSHRYPLDRTLGGPQSMSGTFGKENYSNYWDSNSDPSVAQPVASRYTDYATPASIPYVTRLPVTFQLDATDSV
jgi:hypothetical protein